MAVTTIFGDTADAYIDSSSLTYSNARAGTGIGLDVVTGTSLLVGQTSAFDCYEAFVSFDTSAIADAATVSVVTLSLWLVTDSSATDFTVNVRDRDWGASVTTADFVAGASLSASGTLVASIGSSGIGSTGAYKDFTSQAAFLSVTNIKTGTVHLLLDSSRQEGNNTPSGNEFLEFSSADTSGTTQDPKLTITTAGGAPPPFQVTTPRVWSVF